MLILVEWVRSLGAVLFTTKPDGYKSKTSYMFVTSA